MFSYKNVILNLFQDLTVSGSINANVKNQESGSKSKALLNDNSHTSIHPALQTSELAPTQPSLIREGKKAAFTLAEVLITLGIIGVVAAMTLPTLIQKYQEKQTVTALKKFYSVASQAFEMAKNEYGEPDNWAADAEMTPRGPASELFISKMKPYFKIMKDCGYEEEGCFAEKYNTIGGADADSADATHAKFVLNSGESISFFLNSKECKYKSDTAGNTPQLKNICGGLHVDINGLSKPNVTGKDFFLFFITKYGIIPAGSAADNTEYKFTSRCRRTDLGGSAAQYSSHACAAWVIYNENMDYLHCDDLSWDGKHTCK